MQMQMHNNLKQQADLISKSQKGMIGQKHIQNLAYKLSIHTCHIYTYTQVPHYYIII